MESYAVGNRIKLIHSCWFNQISSMSLIEDLFVSIPSCTNFFKATDSGKEASRKRMIAIKILGYKAIPGKKTNVLSYCVSLAWYPPEPRVGRGGRESGRRQFHLTE